MELLNDSLALSRLQFALTAMFHILWPLLTVGLSIFLVILEAMWLKTKDRDYYVLTRFWSKLFLPVSTGLMVFLAVPFVFGSLRSVAISQRLLSGILVGITFFLLSEGFTRMGVVYELPALVSAATPTFIIGLFAWYLFRRVR